MKRIVAFVVLVLASGLLWRYSGPLQFVAGGVLINLGYRLQDPLEHYDFKHHEGTPEEVWTEFLSQNRAASAVRAQWPRTARHPLIAMVVCMDARLDTNEIAGDTRRYYYVLRLAGSALAPKDEEMLALAVANGVKVVIFTTHTDCAAEKAVADPAKRRQFPALVRAVEEREVRFEEFRMLPLIHDKIASRDLLVKWLDLDTMNERLLPHSTPAKAGMLQ